MRKKRRDFRVPYLQRYGHSREIRGERMARNIIPKNNVVHPQRKVFRALNTVAEFTPSNLYVENVFESGQIKSFLLDRTFIVVRSQKYNNDGKYYFVHLKERLQNINVRNISRYFENCTCLDSYRWCKHMYAVKFNFQGHEISLR